MTSTPEPSPTKTPLTHDELRRFTGSGLVYMHRLHLAYTEGVRHLANRGDAYWLIDAISSWIGSKAFREAASKDSRIECMHFWKLTVLEDRTAVLTARVDSPVEPFIVQSIPFTDFPLSDVDIWAGHDGKSWTLYLPSEH